MILKQLKFSLLGLTAVMLNSNLLAAPLVSIGDVATVSFDGRTSLKWDSNIFRQETNEVKDMVLTFSPGLSAVIGQNATDLDINLSTGYDFVRYQDKDDLNSELFNIRANSAYRSSRLVVSANASFVESKSNNETANRNGDLLERQTTKFGVNGEYTLSPKFSVGVGYNYNKVEYVGEFAPDYSNSTNVRIPVDIFYELTPKLDLSVGYTMGDIEPEGRANASSDNYNVGLRGELMPKLVGKVKVGHNSYSSPTRDTSSISLNGSLNYTMSTKLTHSLNMHRDFDSSATGVGLELTKLNLSSTYVVNQKTTVTGRAGYSIRDYLSSSRKDKLTTLGIDGRYKIDNNWSVSAGYVYTSNDSSSVNSSYDDNILNLAVLLHY